MQCAQVGIIQFGSLAVLNHKTSAFALNIHPDRIQTVENAADTPLVCSALHTVGEAAFDRLNVRILSAIPLGDPSAALKMNGDTAELGLLLAVGVPGLEVVVPVFRPADLIQTVLNGTVGHIRNRHTAHFVFVCLL